MRISVDDEDRGYVPDAILYAIFLDGEYLHDCITADEELGEAYCYMKDTDGRYVLTASREEIRVERLTGVVRIEKVGQQC